MSSTIGDCLLPTLKVAQLLALLPCTNLQDNGRFRPSKKLSVAARILSLCFLAPITIAVVIRDNFKRDPIIGISYVFRICFSVSSVLYIFFQSLCCWYFVSNICSHLTNSYVGFRSVEQIFGVKFDHRLKNTIKFYQVLGILVSFVLCVKFILSFLANGRSLDVQLLLNFTRLQMYVVEQLIVTVSLLFAMCFQQLAKCITNFRNNINSQTHLTTKPPKLVWNQLQFPNAHSVLRVRASLKQLSNALAAFQDSVSLFLLLDIIQHTMNVISFSTYLIVNGVGFDYALDFALIFADAFVRTVILTFSCGQPSLEMENIAEAASCVVSSSMEKYSKEELKMLLEEARSRKVKFTSLGLFSVDRQLLFSIVGTAVSYIVLICQMQTAA